MGGRHKHKHKLTTAADVLLSVVELPPLEAKALSESYQTTAGPAEEVPQQL